VAGLGEIGKHLPRVAVPLPPGVHDEATKKALRENGLPEDTTLGVTSGGRTRHLVFATPGENPDTLCKLFRPGTSMLRFAKIEDTEPLCQQCLKTLGAEVMRAKHAMRNQREDDE
jgi:hypothetical protein